MDDFIAFPPSPVIMSEVLYRCGADFCEEGLQFCNTYDRRCEYCADHHHDCFTYVQQQNCTQYCQDQWKKNQPDVSGNQLTGHEDVYKILFIVFFALWLITFVILLLRVACIRRVIWNTTKHFLPNQVVVFFETVLSKCKSATSGSTDDRNRRPQDVDGTPIEDTEAMQRVGASEGIGVEQITEIPSPMHETGRKTAVATEESRVIKGPGTKTNENKESLKPKISNSTDTHQAMNGSVSKCAEAKMCSKFDIPEDNDKDELNERKRGIQQFKIPIIREECAVRQSTTVNEPDTTSRTLTEAGGQLYIPHGELSTMSSREGYQAMLLSSNQSTDNGYATFIPNITPKDTKVESKS